MQHLDEGTIHSWLDGALSADEAARVEAHVKECPQCASVVAEARGFIAASSRILTALDHAPRGVVPIAAPRRRVDPWILRVAATVLVVAAGTLVVVQNRTSTDTVMSARAKTELPIVAEPIAAADQASPQTGVSDAPATGLSKRAVTQIPRPEVSARENRALAEGGLARAGKTADVSGNAGAATPTAPTVAAPPPAVAHLRMADVAAMDAATERNPLKVVGTPRRIGAKVTLYEVAPGDTVTLTESIPSYLSSVVVTGAAVAATAQAAGAIQKSAAPSKARADVAANARESQAAGGAAAAPPVVSMPAPNAQTETANTLNTITWNDSATGNTLSLTGRMPQSRLQAVRIRIERERAAAAKKNP
jgi:putative zinc finger protein